MHVKAAAQRPLVTVAISSFNHAPYIRQSIMSVLEQNYPQLELLVFDDGSTDGSVDIVRELADRHGFFFSAQQNQGLSATLNQALAMAQGDYFVPFGSDDIMMLDRISRQVDYLQAHPELAACGGNVLKIDSDGTLLPKVKINPAGVQEFRHVLLNMGPGIAAPTMFFRTSILRAIGGFDPTIPLEDLYIKLKLTYEGHRIGVMNDVLAYYRIHETNTYKRLDFMLANVLATYDRFRTSEFYEQARYQYLNAMLQKAAKRDRPLAKKILKMIPLRHYRKRTWRAILRLLFTRS